MRSIFLAVSRKCLKIFHLNLYRLGIVESLLEQISKSKQIVIEVLDFIPDTSSKELIKILKLTKSQHGQDIAALAYND